MEASEMVVLVYEKMKIDFILFSFKTAYAGN